MEIQKLTGQVAVVTGDGCGFGREIARTMAKAGVKVAVVARSPEQLVETVALSQDGGGHAIAISVVTTQPRVESSEKKDGWGDGNPPTHPFFRGFSKYA